MTRETCYARTDDSSTEGRAVKEVVRELGCWIYAFQSLCSRGDWLEKSDNGVAEAEGEVEVR